MTRRPYLLPFLCGLALLAGIAIYLLTGDFYRFGTAWLKVPPAYLAQYYPASWEERDSATAIAFHVTLSDFAAPKAGQPQGDFTVLALLSYQADLLTDSALLNLLKKFTIRSGPSRVEGRYLTVALTDSHFGDTLYLARDGSYPGFFTCRHPVRARELDWPMACEVVESLGSGADAKLPDGRSKVVLDYFVPQDQAQHIPEIDVRLRALIGGFEEK